MKYLLIDNTKHQPIRGVSQDGKAFGSTQLLNWNELGDYAKWIGLYGGRALLDKFEVQLIRDGMLWIWPVGDDGDPLHDECECQEIRRQHDEPRLAWIPKIKCETCLGRGHFVVDGREVEEDDLCTDCDGHGWIWGSEFETDMQGNPLQNALH